MLIIDSPMPKYCHECPCRNEKTSKCNLTFHYIDFKRPGDCPLVENTPAKWIRFSKNIFECSYCGNKLAVLDNSNDIKRYKYCYICGKPMTIEEDEDNIYPTCT